MNRKNDLFEELNIDKEQNERRRQNGADEADQHGRQ